MGVHGGLASVFKTGQIDLHRVHRQLVQAGQRGVAGTEVVQRDADPQRLQRAQPAAHRLVLRRQALGDLQLQRRRRGAAGQQDAVHLLDQAGLVQLHRRQVDRQRGRRPRAQCALPGAELVAGGVQHEAAELYDLNRRSTTIW